MSMVGTGRGGQGHPAASVPAEPNSSASPSARGHVGFSTRLSVRDRGRGGDAEGRVEQRPRERQCAKHQGHLGEEGESSFCKRNNICGVGAEHL